MILGYKAGFVEGLGLTRRSYTYEPPLPRLPACLEHQAGGADARNSRVPGCRQWGGSAEDSHSSRWGVGSPLTLLGDPDSLRYSTALL